MPKTITGTKAGETLTGTEQDDLIYGLDGKDVLIGLGGNDLLDGGRGGDRLEGGAGNDTYVVDSISDTVVELLDQGIDLVQTSLARFKLPSNVENLTFTGPISHFGYGNFLDNVITGSSGVDRLYGGGGNDTLIGNGGRDYLSGNGGRDTLLGGSGDDLLFGGAGNDLLDGGLGGDTMTGGKGNDVYIVDNPLDTVLELAGGGNRDEVRSRVDFTLSANVEILTFYGTNSTHGTGNGLDNTLTGNDQRNVLDGRDGRDTLDGGKGNDELTGGAGADRFVFSTPTNRATNVDLITDFSSFERDKIVLSTDVFTDFAGIDRVTADTFLAGPHATKAVTDGQFLIYDTSTGALYYDAGGTGGRPAVQIAQIGDEIHPGLTWNDFLLI